MWVEKRKNGTYICKERYIDPLTGKTRKVAITIDRDTKAARRDAEEALRAKIEAMTMDTVDDTKITLKEMSVKYIEHQMMNTKEQTWKRDKSITGIVVRILGEDVQVNKVTARYIDDKLRGTGKPNTTMNTYLKHIKMMYKWAYRHDYVSDISFLMKLQDYPDKGKRERIEDKFLSSDELSALLKHMKVDRWRLLTQFLALSGLRIGEAIALNDADVTDAITVNKTVDVNTKVVTDSAKTDAGNREVHIQPELRKVVEEIRAYRKKECFKMGYRTDIFFPDSTGERLDYFSYNKYLKENSIVAVGRPLTPHALRHTHVSLLAEAGYPLDAISRRVGHNDSKITKKIYLHITEKQKEKDNRIMDGIRLIK